MFMDVETNFGEAEFMQQILVQHLYRAQPSLDAGDTAVSVKDQDAGPSLRSSRQTGCPQRHTR